MSTSEEVEKAALADPVILDRHRRFRDGTLDTVTPDDLP